MISVDSSIIEFNRKTLASVPKWIEKQHWLSPPSIFNYGLPERVYDLVDLPISNDPTEVDILCHLARNVGTVNYLEIGVAVGKTFFQIVQFCRTHLPGSKFSCLDIEDPNPNFAALLNRQLGEPLVTSRPIGADRITFNSGLSRADCNKIYDWNSEVRYFAGNEFDPSIWEAIDSRFNLVFSDAYHSPEALLFEYEQLAKNNLLDYPNLTYCFDDLEDGANPGAMWQGVVKIHGDIVRFKPSAKVYHLVVNGWLGQHEYAHHFGVIT